MYVLATLKDKIKVMPHNFQDDMSVPVIDEINRRYCNKVIANVGLCISVHQIVEMAEMFIYPNEGAAYIVTVFNMTMFRPFIDEVLVGKVYGCTPEGVRVSLDFFEDIFVPANNLPTPHEFQEGSDGSDGAEASENTWVWKYEGENMDMMEGDRVRFRVEAVNYHETRKDTYLKSTIDTSGHVVKPKQPYTAPMTIRADMAGEGLGRTEWWF